MPAVIRNAFAALSGLATCATRMLTARKRPSLANRSVKLVRTNKESIAAYTDGSMSANATHNETPHRKIVWFRLRLRPGIRVRLGPAATASTTQKRISISPMSPKNSAP
jgi:hypothetical protein